MFHSMTDAPNSNKRHWNSSKNEQNKISQNGRLGKIQKKVWSIFSKQYQKQVHWGDTRAVTNNPGLYNQVTFRFSTLKVRVLSEVISTVLTDFKGRKIIGISAMNSACVKLSIGQFWGWKWTSNKSYWNWKVSSFVSFRVSGAHRWDNSKLLIECLQARMYEI